MNHGAVGLSRMPAGRGEVTRRAAEQAGAENGMSEDGKTRESSRGRLDGKPGASRQGGGAGLRVVGAVFRPARPPALDRPSQSAVSPPFGTFDHAACPGSGDHAGRFAFAVSITTR